MLNDVRGWLFGDKNSLRPMTTELRLRSAGLVGMLFAGALGAWAAAGCAAGSTTAQGLLGDAGGGGTPGDTGIIFNETGIPGTGTGSGGPVFIMDSGGGTGTGTGTGGTSSGTGTGGCLRRAEDDVHGRLHRHHERSIELRFVRYVVQRRNVRGKRLLVDERRMPRRRDELRRPVHGHVERPRQLRHLRDNMPIGDVRRRASARPAAVETTRAAAARAARTRPARKARRSPTHATRTATVRRRPSATSSATRPAARRCGIARASWRPSRGATTSTAAQTLTARDRGAVPVLPRQTSRTGE